GALVEEAEYGEAAEEDEAGEDGDDQELAVLVELVEVIGEGQQPELDAHHQDADGEAEEDDALLAGRRAVFGITAALDRDGQPLPLLVLIASQGPVAHVGVSSRA